MNMDGHTMQSPVGASRVSRDRVPLLLKNVVGAIHESPLQINSIPVL
jgi:hypothetical protein